MHSKLGKGREGKIQPLHELDVRWEGDSKSREEKNREVWLKCWRMYVRSNNRVR